MKFEIGEIVSYKGKQWEVADHKQSEYLLWSPDDAHKTEIEEWIPERFLAEVE